MSYEYKFVVISSTYFFSSTKQEEYRDIIEEHAREGWRLVQIFAPGTSFHGKTAYFEIIFEREEK